MPIFSFHCQKCHKQFDQLFTTFVAMSKEKTNVSISCPSCGSDQIKQQVTQCSHIFKCKGFYTTDKGDS